MIAVALVMVIFCDTGVLQFPDVVLCNRRSHEQAGRSGFDPFFPDRPET
jgi:hypothetical protein